MIQTLPLRSMRAWCRSKTILGVREPDAPAWATSQKCVRAGVKHNDLDMSAIRRAIIPSFEMLGNSAFGIISKKQAIAMLWELVTYIRILGLQDKLLVTV